MSTIANGASRAFEEETRTGDPGALPRPAKLYFAAIVASAVALAVPILAGLSVDTPGWRRFAVIVILAAVAQLFMVQKPGNQSYKSSIVFLLPAVILLAAPLLVLVAALVYLPEWLKSRKSPKIQTFNIAKGVLDTLCAWSAFRLVSHVLRDLTSSANLRFALAGLFACVVYIAVNHMLLALILKFTYGRTLRETKLFTFDYFATDLFLATLGVGVAGLWLVNPWLIPLVVAPLVLIHQALSVPQLQAEARVDAKTGLYNARHFATVLEDEIGRATRFERPMSLLMADLDLLRDINNTYGHLAGDAVLRGIAEVFRGQLRHYDVPARFGGEEFCILLPETPPEQAYEIAERIRRAVAERDYEVETSSEPVRATVSIGVATFPRDGAEANELIHQADLAVYRAKLQGRNRVLDASSEPLLSSPPKRTPRLMALPDDEPQMVKPLPPAPKLVPPQERRNNPRPRAVPGPRFFSVSKRLASLVFVVSLLGVAAGILGAVFGHTTDIVGLVAIIALVGIGQALALEVEDTGSISVSAVGALAGAALFGPRAALALGITIATVEWSARRAPLHMLLFNVGALSLASLAAVFVFTAGSDHGIGELVAVVASLGAGAAYFAINTGLLSLALAIEGRENWWRAWQERFAWLLPHYIVYGFVGGVIALAYHEAGLYALAVFSVPLLLMRNAQGAYLKHTQRSAQKLRQAAETIQGQNVSLESANRLLKERSTAAMESLSATVDARDAYTAGHSRRVQQLALAIGRELDLSQAELELLGHAALFHDIGKLAIPDAILLKPASLTEEEWTVMARHAEEGAHIINRLGFLNDAVPAIRNHHERFDGQGYPDGLKGDEIPLGARIIHVADAFDSMLTTRVYRPARPAEEALAELRCMSGTQFCPRCVTALDSIVAVDKLDTPPRQLVAS